MTRLFSFITALLLVASSAQAASAAAGTTRLCTEQDLVGGTWRLISLTETPPLRESAWYALNPAQYLAFYTDHYYSFVATDAPFTTPPTLQKALSWPQEAHRALRYALNTQGVLDLYIDKEMTYRYRCYAALQTAGGYQKGDLVLTGYTQGAESQLYKLYRRWY